MSLALGELGVPLEVQSIGGRLGYVDDGNTPNTQIIWCKFASAPMIFEVRGLPENTKAQKDNWRGGMDKYQGVSVGVVIECENGSLRIPNYTSAQALDARGNSIKKWSGTKNHFANFIDCVRSGQAGQLNAGIVEGHLSALPCHLASTSHQVGVPASVAEIKTQIKDNVYFSEALERMLTHLKANAVDLANTQLTLGRPLIGSDSNSIIEASTADTLTRPWLFRDGRGEFRFPRS